jgi:amino acid transporter
MSLQDLINWLDSRHIYVLYYYAIILVSAIICALTVNRNNISTIKYVMSALVYSVAIPGILALFLSLYNILFLHRSMLDVNILSYFLPILAMIIVLFILNRKVKMSQLPGFTKLSSLFIMISIAFILIFILQKTYFGVLILGSFTQLLLVFAVILIVLKIAWAKFSK